MDEAGGEWRWSAFDELTGREVYDLLRLRMDVFVVEQNCAFSEIDGKDPGALHLRCLVGSGLAGCLRVLPPGTPDGAPRIGRIATASRFRGSGLGHRLMEEGLRFCAEHYPASAIDLSAQAHLEPFYGRHGFTTVSAPYLEDGIPHLDMRRPAG